MLRKRSKLTRALVIFASSGGSIAELARGIWHGGPGKRWMLPLAVFLSALGLVLVLAASVEALAPFVYSIF
jgi:hypothetical protein